MITFLMNVLNSRFVITSIEMKFKSYILIRFIMEGDRGKYQKRSIILCHIRLFYKCIHCTSLVQISHLQTFLFHKLKTLTLIMLDLISLLNSFQTTFQKRISMLITTTGLLTLRLTILRIIIKLMYTCYKNMYNFDPQGQSP